MAITKYTSYSEVRSAIGLSSEELPDEVINLKMYDDALTVALSGITLPDEEPGPGPVSDRFDTIKAIAEASRTDAQVKLLALIRLFATYSVAAELANSLAMRTPKQRSDAKASLTRFSSEATFRDTQEALIRKVGELTYAMENINDTTVAVDLPWLTAITPDTDVVTDS